MTEKVSEVGEATESELAPQQEKKVEQDPVAALTEDLQRLQAEYSNYKKSCIILILFYYTRQKTSCII